jgi:transcriptional regulator with XRE-family HTH domain
MNRNDMPLTRNDVPPFGPALAEARRRAGLTATEVEWKTGILSGNLSRLETNRRSPTWQTIYMLIVGCKFDLGAFFPDDLIIGAADRIRARRGKAS